MRNTGIVRQLDELGRIVLPVELRRHMGLSVGDAVEVFVDDELNRIMFRKYQAQQCMFCDKGISSKLEFYRGKYICTACLHEMKLTFRSICDGVSEM